MSFLRMDEPAAGRARVRAAGIAVLCAWALAVTGCGAVGSGDTASPDRSTTSQAQRLKDLAKYWADYYKIQNPPRVKVVRYLETEELNQVHRQCLEDEGFPSSSEGGNTVPDGQMDAFHLAEYVCRMKYPLKREYDREWGRQQIEKQYEWTRDFLIPCLTEAGHPIEGLPSKQVFIETWESDPFFPFRQVKIPPTVENFDEEWGALEQKCPQEAPGSVVWGKLSIQEWKKLAKQKTARESEQQ